MGMPKETESGDIASRTAMSDRRIEKGDYSDQDGFESFSQDLVVKIAPDSLKGSHLPDQVLLLSWFWTAI